MAEDLSVTTMIGRLTRDLDLQYTNTGYAVGVGSIAVNSREKKGDQWEDYASFFDIKLLGKRAESLAQYMTKGTRIGLSGRLKQERWPDRQSGQNRSKVVFMVESVQLLGDGERSNSQPQNYDNRQPGPPGHNGQQQSPPDHNNERFEDDIPF